MISSHIYTHIMDTIHNVFADFFRDHGHRQHLQAMLIALKVSGFKCLGFKVTEPGESVWKKS